MLTNIDQEIVFDQPKTEGERALAARTCQIGMQLEMPMLLDHMSNAVDEAYAALPERLYVIDREGTITYRSDPGPWGFAPADWEKAILEAAVLNQLP